MSEQEARRMRCGDTARIDGADYDIEVSYADYETGYLSWCGWPDGCAKIDSARLVTACSDEDHRAAVARWLDRSPMGDDSRPSYVKRLYRPRAFAREQFELARQRLADAESTYAAAHRVLVEAERGPEDA